MEFAPAPVSCADGVCTSLLPPRVPPGVLEPAGALDEPVAPDDVFAAVAVVVDVLASDVPAATVVEVPLVACEELLAGVLEPQAARTTAPAASRAPVAMAGRRVAAGAVGRGSAAMGTGRVLSGRRTGRIRFPTKSLKFIVLIEKSTTLGFAGFGARLGRIDGCTYRRRSTTACGPCSPWPSGGSRPRPSPWPRRRDCRPSSSGRS